MKKASNYPNSSVMDPLSCWGVERTGNETKSFTSVYIPRGLKEGRKPTLHEPLPCYRHIRGNTTYNVGITSLSQMSKTRLRQGVRISQRWLKGLSKTTQ